VLTHLRRFFRQYRRIDAGIASGDTGFTLERSLADDGETNLLRVAMGCSNPEIQAGDIVAGINNMRIEANSSEVDAMHLIRSADDPRTLHIYRQRTVEELSLTFGGDKDEQNEKKGRKRQRGSAAAEGEDGMKEKKKRGRKPGTSKKNAKTDSPDDKLPARQQISTLPAIQHLLARRIKRPKKLGGEDSAVVVEGGGGNIVASIPLAIEAVAEAAGAGAEAAGARAVSLDIDNLVSNNAPPVIEYLVKWQSRAYLHTEWVDEELLLTDYKAVRKLQHYLKKLGICERSFGVEGNVDEEPFNPSYLEVDRILEEQVEYIEEGGETGAGAGGGGGGGGGGASSSLGGAIQQVKKTRSWFRCKWRFLPYLESTWELAEYLTDADRDHIARYRRFNVEPKPEKCTPITPKGMQFSKIKTSPKFKNELTLRSYQLEGVNWLVFQWHQQRSCILADEMGLGKTCQTVSFINFLCQHRRNRGPYIVIVPLSTIGHWQREFEAWTDLNAIMYHGNAENRAEIRNVEFFFPAKPGAKAKKEGGGAAKPRYKFNVLITTFEMAIQDASHLARINWHVLVVDEAHRLKNRQSKLHDTLENQYNVGFCVLLTGTPIQNTTEELWCLLHFVDAQRFASQQNFLQDFGEVNSSEQVQKLQEMLKPYLLRRIKSDVEALPPKTETIIDIELTAVQKQYYRAVLEKNRKFLDKGCAHGNAPSLMNVLMQLRKLCNHPFLLQGVEHKLVHEYGEHEERQAITDGKAEAGGGSANSSTALVQAPRVVGAAGALYARALTNLSGKLVLLDKLLPKIQARGSQVLIFSQMVRMLDILADYMYIHSYSYERLDGNIRGEERQAAIDRFSRKENASFVFLLSTRAGGLGLNLQSADTIIIFDSDWNPQNDVQAQARSHRIGQTQAVKVYRLVTRKTYESQLFERASHKLGLDRAILGHFEGGDSSASARLKPNEIDELLRKGAYDLLCEDEETSAATSKEFAEEDIDRLLQTSTREVQWDDGSMSAKPSVFSKASFVSSSAGANVDINDPEFWAKMIPAGASPAETLLARLKLIETAVSSAGGMAPLHTPILSSQVRLAFINDLQAVVNPVVNARANGEMPEGMEEVLALLSSVQKSESFAATTPGDTAAVAEVKQSIVKCVRWVQAIEKPKRKRKQVQGMYSEAALDEIDGTTEMKAREKKDKKEKQLQRAIDKEKKAEIREAKKKEKEERRVLREAKKQEKKLERESSKAASKKVLDQKKKQREDAKVTAAHEREVMIEAAKAQYDIILVSAVFQEGQLGLKLIRAVDTGKVHVWNVIPGTQAEREGVQRSDTLIAVNETQVVGRNYEDIVKMIAEVPTTALFCIPTSTPLSSTLHTLLVNPPRPCRQPSTPLSSTLHALLVNPPRPSFR
jgi:superfamily II DNA or RNA helicase